MLCVAYMLPVGAMVKKEANYSLVDMDDEKEDITKKEKKVEVIIVKNTIYKAAVLSKISSPFTSYYLSSLFHTIETPPPDFM